MNRKFQWHSLNFSQKFYPISQETFLFNIYRFQVFKYIPIKVKFSNVKYYFISDHDYGAGEFALVGICNYEDDGIMKQDCRLLIKSGDREVFHYVKTILLQKLADKKMISEKKWGVVDVDDYE